jgi:hypothetical protein
VFTTFDIHNTRGTIQQFSEPSWWRWAIGLVPRAKIHGDTTESALFTESGHYPNLTNCAESFFHSLKVEALQDEPIMVRETMGQHVFEYIEVDYNKLKSIVLLAILAQ